MPRFELLFIRCSYVNTFQTQLKPKLQNAETKEVIPCKKFPFRTGSTHTPLYKKAGAA